MLEFYESIEETSASEMVPNVSIMQKDMGVTYRLREDGAPHIVP